MTCFFGIIFFPLKHETCKSTKFDTEHVQLWGYSHFSCKHRNEYKVVPFTDSVLWLVKTTTGQADSFHSEPDVLLGKIHKCVLENSSLWNFSNFHEFFSLCMNDFSSGLSSQAWTCVGQQSASSGFVFCPQHTTNVRFIHKRSVISVCLTSAHFYCLMVHLRCLQAWKVNSASEQA